MTFTTVPINVAGPTYQSRSRPLSSQRTVNFYQQFAEGGKDPFVLHSFPGQKSLDNSLTGVDRGMHQMNEVLFRVIGDTLYKVSDAFVHTSLGTITGANRCIFADDGDNLVVVSDRVWVYTSSSDTFQENTNVNLPGTIAVTFINSVFIYTQPDLSFVSQPNNPFDVSGLDAIAAESNPDKMARDYAFNQTIYRMGKRTGEPWYSSGVGHPPIDRIDGQQFSVGLGAIHSMANTDRALYWLGDDRAIYRISGGASERISDDALSNTIENMTTFDDAIAYTFTLQGQDFYLITFPTENRTFVNNQDLGVNGWFELTSGITGDSYSGTSLVRIYDKNIIAKGGELLELNLDTFTQDTDTIIRERITQEVNSDLLGVKGQNIKMSRLELIMETGVGLVTGQGVNPRIRIETSIDGGRSFHASAWVEIGRAGEHTKRVELDQMDFGKGFIFKLTISDPVPVSIYSAAIDIKLAGR